jgi:5'-3' exonuclease
MKKSGPEISREITTTINDPLLLESGNRRSLDYMGIKDFLGYYVGGSMDLVGFTTINFRKERIVLDSAGLLFACAVKHSSSYLAGDYTPSLQAFQRNLVYLSSTLQWDMVVVFDGGDSPIKQHERRRRDEHHASASSHAGKIRNEPLYIALACKICRDCFVDYMVAPEEADPQCRYARFARVDGDPTEPTLVVTGDSDLIAYGNKVVMIVGSWAKEEFRIFNFDRDSLSRFVMNNEITDPYQKITTMAYLHFGTAVFQWHAACTGCDFTESGSGIKGFGPKTFMHCLSRLVDAADEYTTIVSQRYAIKQMIFESRKFKGGT